jgi:hypothetical protein
MDSVVFEISSSDYKRENIFLNKNWLSTIDLNNGIYSTNQVIIDSSALSNSNRYINYREGVLIVPLLYTLSCTTNTATFAPNTTGTSCDYCVGMKSFFFSVVHSLSLELQGGTIVQTTPFSSMYQAFVLVTSLSWNDVSVLGPSIGFFPDTSLALGYFPTTATASGVGVCNNQNFPQAGGVVSGAWNSYETFNQGLYKRQQFMNLNADGLTNVGGSAWSALMSKVNLNTIYKSNIIQKANGTGAGNGFGVWQSQVIGAIRLRDLHDFFERIPMAKNLFMKLTLNLNQTSVQLSTDAAAPPAVTVSSVTSPLGGISPIMIASTLASNGSNAALPASLSYIASIAVGADCLNQTQRTGTQLVSGFMRNVTLITPSYQFNPVYEKMYLETPIREVVYNDLYSYQVYGVGTGTNFNSILTNGISGLKSIVVMPVHSPAAINGNISPLLSPSDPCGGGPTSPLVFLNNFQVSVSGQNAIYNTQISTYQNFWNNLNGANCINANQIDGNSGNGLLSQIDFETEYCYFYVDLSRGLPIENQVAKSVTISGTNLSALSVDLYCFLVYESKVVLNLFTGLRV